MTQFVNVAKASDISDQSAKCVEVQGRRICLVNLGGTFYAIDDTCTHAEASLSEGHVTGDEIMCPLHMATFSILTGEVTGPPADEDLATYPVRVNGDDVQIEV